VDIVQVFHAKWRDSTSQVNSNAICRSTFTGVLQAIISKSTDSECNIVAYVVKVYNSNTKSVSIQCIFIKLYLM
jgi:LEA14-like dessication related protein